MELREIRAFLVLAEELHFSRTAERLRIAQSAVSYAIKSLEGEIGTSLFHRTKRRVSLTASGEHFRIHAGCLLGELERTVEETMRVGRGLSGRLSLRFTLLSSLTVVPGALACFAKRYPSVDIDLAPGGSVEQLAALRQGRCDIGFMSFKSDIEPLATQVVQRAPLVALVPQAHALSGRRRLRLAELAGERFVFLRMDSEPQVRAFFRRRCLDAGFEPNIVVETEQLEILLAMVAAGLGVSCLPGLVRTLRFPGVTMLPLSPMIEGGISAVWDPNTLSAAGQNFLTILGEMGASNPKDGGSP